MHATEPLPPLPPLLVRPGATMSAPEVATLVREGVLRPVIGDVHSAASAADDPELRASAVAAILPRSLRAAGAVVSWEAAAWVHAGGPAPSRVDVAVGAGAPRAPARPDGSPVRWVVHQVAVPGADVVRPGDRTLRVTSPARTAVDLARRLPVAEAVPALRALSRAAPVTLHDLLARLEALRGQRGVARARSAVLAWAASDPAAASHPAAAAGHSGRLPIIR